MKRVHVVLIIVAAVAVLGVGVWYFAIWSVKGAFESAAQQGFEPLAGVLKATVGGTIARGDIRFELNSGAESSGAIDLYRNNPQALQRDKEYFDTWSSAMAIARETLQRGHQFTKWQSSQKSCLDSSATQDRWLGPRFLCQIGSATHNSCQPRPSSVEFFGL